MESIESISAENGIFTDQCDPSGGMTGSKHDSKDQLPDVNLIPFVIETCSFRKQEFISCFHGIGCRIQLMDIKIGARFFDDRICCTGMIPMSVGDQDSAAFHVVLLEIVQNGVRLITGIDDGTIHRVFIGNDITVGFQLSYRNCFNQHIGKILP